ncbi:MAG: hypothetical protein B7O98_07990 [Zestosphaera tikiterensis]|uniref:Glycosyl transferase family 1 domain-containing protein n=1 Tax=Zestosphaera tikiterensis TaxID=1973259 RepID=A0A2R7Y3C0_9CREN|nr:MAG: hypothetical protein B7O98_07990 [Zestosphaera tikiterensis]
MFKDRVVYVSMPRYLYRVLARILKWRQHYDLNPLAKLTHYVDEFIMALKLRGVTRSSITLYVFGSMSLFSFFMRLLGWKGTIIYDPLANYVQTLYLRSRISMREILRYGLYLALHRLQLKCSNCVVYPSKLDLENAERMFNVRNTVVIPNPVPICFESHEEYEKLRALRRGDERPYFILLAGGRNKANEEAVKLTIDVFNKLPQDTFKLYITGPWLDLKNLAENSSIELLGVIPQYELKRLLAVSDYGLSPIFSHAAGTFLKTLTYVTAGLDVIATPISLIGLSIKALRKRYGYSGKIYLIHDKEDYEKTLSELIFNKNYERGRPTICHYLELELVNTVRETGIFIGK